MLTASLLQGESRRAPVATTGPLGKCERCTPLLERERLELREAIDYHPCTNRERDGGFDLNQDFLEIKDSRSFLGFRSGKIKGNQRNQTRSKRAQVKGCTTP
jgi:hypothetical protein